jgi:hypothetical protein
MKTSFVLLALGLLGFGPAVAQSSALQAASASGNFVVTPSLRPCSVADMHLRQGSSLQMLRAGDGQSRPVMTPTLTLTPRNGRAILAATVTVHGHSAQPGTLPLVAHLIDKGHPSQSQDLATTVKVNMKPAENGSYSAELLLSGFAVVTSVDLKAVTYADGTTWKVQSEPECSVKPDPLLLIGAR